MERRKAQQSWEVAVAGVLSQALALLSPHSSAPLGLHSSEIRGGESIP